LFFSGLFKEQGVRAGGGLSPASNFTTGNITTANAVYYDKPVVASCFDPNSMDGLTDILKYSNRNVSYKMDPKSAVNFTKTSNSTSYNAGTISRIN
jgi:hypothetical protein